MNIRAIRKVLGFVLCVEAIFMTPATIIAFVNKQTDFIPFLIISFVMFFLGLPFAIQETYEKKFYVKDGFIAVALAWIIMCIAGALPFYFSGAIPTFINSIFESVSGFTTTGASILTDIESLPKGILFWRSMTHWLGGMGVLVLALAILPSIGGSGIYLMKAESTGPSPSKLVPSLRKTALILYAIYTTLTILQIICLKIAGMSFYDAILHAMSTAGTGGFSNKNLSIGSYDSVAIETIITVFMFLFGVNFTVYFTVLTKNISQAFKSEELRVYILIMLTAIILITINTLSYYDNNVLTSLRYSSFQASSIMTTTGFSSTDFNLWPTFSKSILLLLMLIGSCASSTGGGMKVVRIIIMFKSIRISLKKITHPNIVKNVSLNDHVINNNTVINVLIFLLLYITIAIAAFIIISFENFDFATTISSVIASISNIGPGFELVGPLGNYSIFSSFSKMILALCMLVGRLEILPIIFLFAPKKGVITKL
jgi:trk system potassium uptake protein TrkH